MSTATVREPPLGEDRERYEIIDGQRVGLPPMGIRATWIASLLLHFLGSYSADATILAMPLCEALFHLPLPVDRNRRPDVAFVSFERWAKGRPLPARR